MQNQIITEIGKIETAAKLFETGVEMFHDVITEFGEKYLETGKIPEKQVPYNATEIRSLGGGRAF